MNDLIAEIFERVESYQYGMITAREFADSVTYAIMVYVESVNKQINK